MELAQETNSIEPGTSHVPSTHKLLEESLTMKKSIIHFVMLLMIAMPHFAAASELVEVYKNPSCGCCGKWVEHMQKAGFTVRVHEVTDLAPIREKLGMPERYASCHTARVGGYLVEGHVPAADVKRLLKEKPKAIGIAVPGMPPGSPGMESPHPVAYNTLLVHSASESTIFAKH